MSKTVRRKNKKEIPEWVTSDWVRNDNGYVTFWHREPLEGEALKKALVKYHSDCGTGHFWMGNAPAWFRRDKERLKRARDKAELKRIITQGDYEDYSFTPRRKDVGWDWW